MTRHNLAPERALAQATTVHEAKVVADVAAAQEVFASRQQLGETIIGYAHNIKTRALAKLGELLRDMPKATGTRGKLPAGPGRGKKTAVENIPPFVDVPSYADLGLDKATAAVAQQLALLPSAVREAIASQEQTLSQALRERKA
jgi:hypothetical protein